MSTIGLESSTTVWNRQDEIDAKNRPSPGAGDEAFENLFDLIHIPLVIFFVAMLVGISLAICNLSREIWYHYQNGIREDDQGGEGGFFRRRRISSRGSDKSLPSYESVTNEDLDENLPSYEEAKHLEATDKKR